MAKSPAITILPEAMHNMTLTIGMRKLDVRVHWRIKTGYVIARLGLLIVEAGTRFAGLTVKREVDE